MQTVQNSIPDVSGLATKQELQAVENSIPDVSGLATKQELQAVENAIPDTTGLATKVELQAVTGLIPSNASTTNKLATMADIGGGSGSTVSFAKKTQYGVAWTGVLNGLGLTTSDLPLVIKIDFSGTFNNSNVYDSCIFELNSISDSSTNVIHEMAKSSSVKFWKSGNGVYVSGSSSDTGYGNGVYCFSAFRT